MAQERTGSPTPSKAHETITKWQNRLTWGGIATLPLVPFFPILAPIAAGGLLDLTVSNQVTEAALNKGEKIFNEVRPSAKTQTVYHNPQAA